MTYVRDKVNSYAGHQEQLLSVLKLQNLAWFGNVIRHYTLSEVILQEIVEIGRKKILE